MIAGSPLQVSGPAAGLTMIVWAIIQDHGIAALGPIVLLAGAFQVIFGFARLGPLLQCVPPAVIYGMLAGIGALIFASQFHFMVDARPSGSGLENFLTIPESIWKGLTHPNHDDAAMLSILTLSTLIAWEMFVKRFTKFKVVPSALIAVTFVSFIYNIGGFSAAHVSIPENLFGTISFTHFDALSMMSWNMVGLALALAAIARAESLLCATAVDRMHTGSRTDYNRELSAQGLGNTVCGLFGALPMTGVIVRSSANVSAGARTRLSAILHGIWLLFLVATAPFVLQLIPIASLAALLVFTGYKLMKQDLRSLQRSGSSEVYIFFATVAGIVTTDLLKGVLFGFVLAIIKIVWTFTHLHVKLISEENLSETKVLLEGSATFLRLPKLLRTLGTIPPHREVHFVLESFHYVDHASLQVIADWEKNFKARGGRVHLDWNKLQYLNGTPLFRQQKEYLATDLSEVA